MSSQTTRTSPDYRDRQYSRMLLGLGAFIAFGCGVAVGAVFGPGMRVAVWVVVGVSVLIAARRNRLDVVIDDDGVQLGRASLPWQVIERAEILVGPDFRAALTTDAHPNDYRRIRSTDAGMRLWLADPSDPHRAWVASLRDPVAAGAALRERIAA